MEKEIKLKKYLGVVIGIMLFAIAALGITYAYFSGSVSSNANSITSTETIAINYSENKDYMFSGLIPSSLENALIGASKAENKCMDDNNYYVCSLYEFTVDNMSNVSQDIEVYLYQQINGYTNLRYEVYETSINDSNFDTEHKVVNSTSLVYTDSQNELGTKIDGLTKTLTRLDNGTTTDSVTYTLMFYVENKDYNQSEHDGGKQIVADIHVESKVSGSLPNSPIVANIDYETLGITENAKYYMNVDPNMFFVFNGNNFIYYYNNSVLSSYVYGGGFLTTEDSNSDGIIDTLKCNVGTSAGGIYTATVTGENKLSIVTSNPEPMIGTYDGTPNNANVLTVSKNDTKPYYSNAIYYLDGGIENTTGSRAQYMFLNIDNTEHLLLYNYTSGSFDVGIATSISMQQYYTDIIDDWTFANNGRTLTVDGLTNLNGNYTAYVD